MFKMRCLRGGFLFVVITVITAGNCDSSDHLELCPHDHKNLTACVTNLLDKLRPRYKLGIEELKIPPLEPVILNHITVEKPGEGTHLLSDIEIHGASNFQILNLLHFLTKQGHNFAFEILVPHLFITGKYEFSTFVLLEEIKSNGSFSGDVSLHYKFTCLLKQELREEKLFRLNLGKMACAVDISKADLVLNNVFNGGKILDKKTNDLLDKLLLKKMKPSLITAANEKFADIAKNVSLTFKYQ